MDDQPTQPQRPGRWQRFQYGLRYTLALAGGLTVAGVGDYMSFRNLRRFGEQHDFSPGWGLPVGLDAGIPALLLLDSLRPSRFLRLAAWALSAGTVVANAVVTPDQSWIARGLHGIMPALAITWYEAVRRLNRAEADGSTMDRVRLLRYLVSPVRTVRLRFRMIRWEVTSYREALRLESAILLARAVLVSEYGARDWRRTRKAVPGILRHQLDTGQMPAELFFGTDWTPAVRTWVRETLEDLSPAHRPVPHEDDWAKADPSRFPDLKPQDPWELIWELRDRLVPEGTPPEVFAKAYGLARAHFEEVNRHITVDDMRERLGIRKDRAATLAKAFRTAYESDRVLMVQMQDPAAQPGELPDEPDGTAPEPDETTGPYDRDSEPAGSM
ncbi:MAG: DUF2637 domain-containing protein [Actinoallomurus sp.]